CQRMEVWYPTSGIVGGRVLARPGWPETKDAKSNPLIIRWLIMSKGGHTVASANIGQRSVSKCMARSVLQVVPALSSVRVFDLLFLYFLGDEPANDYPCFGDNALSCGALAARDKSPTTSGRIALLGSGAPPGP